MSVLYVGISHVFKNQKSHNFPQQADKFVVSFYIISMVQTSICTKVHLIVIFVFASTAN